MASELISRADLFLQRRNVEMDEKRSRDLGVADEIAGIESLTPAIAGATLARRA